MLMQGGSEYRTSLKEIGCHLNIVKMDAILFSYVVVQYLNGWSSTWDVALKPTIWNLSFKNFWYSNVSAIQMVHIQIPWLFNTNSCEYIKPDSKR